MEDDDAEINLNLDELLRVWSRLLLQAEQQDRRQGINTRTTRSVPNVDALVKLRKSTFALKQISRTDLNLEHCDLQGIDWHDLGVTRNEARRLRSRTYNSYTNLVPERNHVREEPLSGLRLANLKRLKCFGNIKSMLLKAISSFEG